MGRPQRIQFAVLAILFCGLAKAVDIFPGTNIQGVVNANPAGTTFVLKAGVHRMQSIVPKTGDTFVGETGTVLNGSRLLSSFSVQGLLWFITNQTQQGTTNGSCQPGHAGCIYPEDLYLNDVPLLHVTTLAEVAPGKWYFDYANNIIYMGDNPVGQKVETSVTPHAFAGGASLGGATNVTIRGLTIEKYAAPAQDGAISYGSGWKIQNNEIRLNHGGGIRLDDSMAITGNYIHHNGQIGLTGQGTGILVEGNEIAFNNALGFMFNWEAGGTKFFQSTNLVVRGNYAHDNQGPGLSLDYENYNWVVEGNRTSGNIEAGILDEISYDGIIRYNVVENDATYPDATKTGFWWRSGIMVDDSPNAQIYGNSVLNSGDGIGAMSLSRGTGNLGEFLVKNLYVHDNVIVQSSQQAAGAVANTSASTNGYYLNVYTTWNNRFVHNWYKLSSLSGLFYTWYNGTTGYKAMTKDQWQQAGQDTGGTWIAPADTSFPSTKFAVNDRVQMTSGATIRQIPTVAGTAMGTVSPGALGTVTMVRGPIYSEALWWWHVRFDTGMVGWTEENFLQKYSGAADTTAPSAPGNAVLGSATASSLALSWSASTDNVGVAGYRVDVSTNAGFTSMLANYNNRDAGNATTVAVSGLSAGTTYYARVRAYDAAGNISGNSATAQAATTGASNCDVNGDGSVNVADVQLEINAALGAAPCSDDLNHDGVCNVVDVQLVIKAAMGGACGP